ncbi:uncharacterized protein BX664DRAFT_299821 [Halteromyces radiatus]|uniref:uncharacterized protein n=1 Tax=Halteromyces radiatus TaxID=101107 RepID=UPI00221FEBFD|nr:uncharacterized protein BX664DRAFT_299821 [Halteromyces radiatus]KAI8084498.1 hypothetical protein BX664DRAFT_299821 [Halteromyces radiatus]
MIKLNRKQAVALRAIMDTFVAPLDDNESLSLVQDAHQSNNNSLMEGGTGNIDLSAMAATSATDLDDMLEVTLHYMTKSILPHVHQHILSTLRLLSSSLGSAYLTGHRRPFYHLSRPQREQVLLKWKVAKSAQQRQLYRFLSILALYTSYGQSDILRAATGYAHVHHNTSSSSSLLKEDPYGMATKPYHMVALDEAKALQSKKFDVIIVGSGAGAGVIAAQVASVGETVLVIEKGKYYREDEYDSDDISGFAKMYDGDGVQFNKNGSIGIMAASTFGGGTAVSWGVALKPSPSLLNEWSEATDDLFDAKTFNRDLITVSQRMGVSTNTNHNNANMILKKGCMQLGVSNSDCPNDSRNVNHICKVCYAGCNEGGQQRTANSWLRDAEVYGARFLDQTEVTKVLTQNGRAMGVVCLTRNTPLTFISRAVVVAAGSLHTPLLLRRSGLKNKHIGAHLRLHPSTGVLGVYDKQQNVDQAAMSTVMSHVSSRSGYGHHGARIYIPPSNPIRTSIMYPWRGALQHKQFMAKYPRAVAFEIHTSDIDSENTVVEEKGRMTVTSKLSKRDEQSLMDGVVRAFRILAVTGARELHHSQSDIEPFHFDQDVQGVDAVKNPKFNTWLNRIRQNGFPDGLFTTQQLGSCRMGKNPQSSVAKVTGETWEIENLYIGDGSLFITASGVNPMLTIETLAYGISRHIINRLENR